MVASALRSFFVVFCAALGLALSVMVIVVFMGIFSSGNKIIERDFAERIEPNASGSIEALPSAPVVLELKISDVIGVGRLTAHRVRDVLAASRRDDRVKAVLLAIDSPGGSAFDSEQIYQAILDYKARYQVPVYAYVDGLCASGGMMIACAADKIYSSSGSIVGSVGVVTQHVNAVDLLKKIGVDALTISSGLYKDDMNPLRTWTPDEIKRTQGIVDFFYSRFLTIVTDARKKLSKEKLVSVYGAQVFPAPTALEYGYIDVVGATRNQTLADLSEAAGVKGDVQVLSLQEDRFFGGFLNEESALLTGRVVHTLETPIPMKLMNQPLYLYLP